MPSRPITVVAVCITVMCSYISGEVHVRLWCKVSVISLLVSVRSNVTNYLFKLNKVVIQKSTDSRFSNLIIVMFLFTIPTKKKDFVYVHAHTHTRLPDKLSLTVSGQD